MRGSFHAGNVGFHKICFSPFFLTLSLGFVGVRWRHFVQTTQNRVSSPIPTRFHLKAKRVVTNESVQHGGRRDVAFVIVSFIKSLNKYDR